MNTLEILFENKIQHSIFLERKQKIISPYTLVIGPKSSGKSYLIYDYLLRNENKIYLYIDLHNLKDLKFNASLLQEFINLKKIDILVIENYDYSFVLPEVDSVILSSNKMNHLENFILVEIMPLDFEEYLSFDIKHQNTTNSFNSFLKYGNLPQVINFKDINKQNRNYEIIKLHNNNETKFEILKLFIKNAALLKSPYWLYTVLKQEIKISKDFFYKTVKEYEQNNTILFCPKFNSPKAVKKIYCYNHAFIDTVTYNKNFLYLFSNMIYLELYTRYKNIYYSDNIDFYVEENKTIYLSIPFYNQTHISSIGTNILKSTELMKYDKIYIITISNSNNIYINNTECEILPFYEWATTI
jgi:hypothetical protein